MNEITRIVSEIESGDATAAEQLLPLVYDELRKLAAQRLRHEKPGQTLQPTGLVHEAYLRLMGGENTPHWDSRGHFFAAAAEAMRRILVENARRKGRLKRGGGSQRLELNDVELCVRVPPEELLAIDEALTKLQQHEPQAAELVKLRYFAGLEHGQAAESLGISRRTADRLWAVARAWLFRELSDGEEK